MQMNCDELVKYCWTGSVSAAGVGRACRPAPSTVSAAERLCRTAPLDSAAGLRAGLPQRRTKDPSANLANYGLRVETGMSVLAGASVPAAEGLTRDLGGWLVTWLADSRPVV